MGCLASKPQPPKPNNNPEPTIAKTDEPKLNTAAVVA